MNEGLWHNRFLSCDIPMEPPLRVDCGLPYMLRQGQPRQSQQASRADLVGLESNGRPQGRRFQRHGREESRVNEA
jgi:hypothetical protein